MKHLLLLLLAFPVHTKAQKSKTNAGMHFEHNLSWAEVKAKAKKENKFIFVDAFTTWCGPCSYMTANIFPMKEVGDFFNPRFINLKVQIDSTGKDAAEVKSWYAESRRFSKDYNIRAFPTYLYFDPNGNLVHRSGGSSDAGIFISAAKDALDPSKQYYTLLEKYKNGEREIAFLRNFVIAAYDADDSAGVAAYQEYITNGTDLLSKENIPLLARYTNSTKDTGFALMLQYPEKFNEAMGTPGRAQAVIRDLIYYEEALPTLSSSPDFNKLSSDVETKYPGYGKAVAAKTRTTFYKQLHDQVNYEQATIELVNETWQHITDDELNEFAWDMFTSSKSETVLEKALSWSERSFKSNNNAAFIDTYANLLYKLGRKKEAIQWETKAVSLAAGADKNDYQQTLKKMKSGSKM